MKKLSAAVALLIAALAIFLLRERDSRQDDPPARPPRLSPAPVVSFTESSSKRSASSATSDVATLASPTTSEVATKSTVAATRSSCVLEGTVRVERGDPIPDALVTVRSWSGATHETRADAHGRFRFELPSGIHDVDVRAPGFVRAALWAEEVHLFQDGKRDLILVPESEIRLRVRSTDGTPIAAEWGTVHDNVEGSSRDGELVLAKRRPGLERFFVAAEGHVRRWFDDVLVLEGVATELDVVLERSGSVEGTVRDSSRAPAAGALVSLRTRDSKAQRVHVDIFDVRADAEGRYRVSGLPARPTIVVARGAKELTTRTITVVAGQTVTADFELAPPPRLDGRVIDRRGRPVPRCKVVAMGLGCSESCETDPDGRFTLTGCLGSAWIRAGRTWENGDSLIPLGSLSAPEGKPEGSSVEVVLEDGAPLTGVVVGKDGRPCRASVCVTGVGFHEYTRADDGRFAFGNLPQGKVEVSATSWDETRRVGRATVTLGATLGATPSEVRIELVDKGCVAGTLEARSRPLGSIPLEIAGAQDKVRTRRDGGFSVELEAGEHELRIAEPVLSLVAKKLGVRRAWLPRTVLVVPEGKTLETRIELATE